MALGDMQDPDAISTGDPNVPKGNFDVMTRLRLAAAQGQDPQGGSDPLKAWKVLMSPRGTDVPLPLSRQTSPWWLQEQHESAGASSPSTPVSAGARADSLQGRTAAALRTGTLAPSLHEGGPTVGSSSRGVPDSELAGLRSGNFDTAFTSRDSAPYVDKGPDADPGYMGERNLGSVPRFTQGAQASDTANLDRENSLDDQTRRHIAETDALSPDPVDSELRGRAQTSALEGAAPSDQVSHIGVAQGNGPMKFPTDLNQGAKPGLGGIPGYTGSKDAMYQSILHMLPVVNARDIDQRVSAEIASIQAQATAGKIKPEEAQTRIESARTTGMQEALVHGIMTGSIHTGAGLGAFEHSKPPSPLEQAIERTGGGAAQ